MNNGSSYQPKDDSPVSGALANLAQIDIFTLLGISPDDPDRDAFRREVEDAIWEEIMTIEVAPHLQPADLQKMENILADNDLDEEQKRTAMFGFLADKLPNMEEVVERYTRQAKSDLFQARLEGLEQYFAQQGDIDKKQQVQQASEMFARGEYAAAVQVVNKL